MEAREKEKGKIARSTEALHRLCGDPDRTYSRLLLNHEDTFRGMRLR